ncbi:MAG: hypothetical protein AAFZ05_06830 [Pseudomonadota bacterium]
MTRISLNTVTFTAAGLGTAILFAATPALADPNVLDEAQIQSQVIGKTLTGRRGPLRFRMVHRTDGTSRMETPFRSMDGTWRVAEGKLCMTWPKLRSGQERCTGLTALGDDKYRTEGGAVFTVE